MLIVVLCGGKTVNLISMNLVPSLFGSVVGSVAAFAVFIVVNSITPGPNNLMLLHGSLKQGFLACRFHILGISFGLGVMLWISYWGLATVFVNNPNMGLVIKVLGTGYLLWLTYHMWQTDFTQIELLPNIDNATSSSVSNKISKVTLPLTFWQATLFQWLNPKIWTMVVFAPGLAYIAGQAAAPSLWRDNLPLVAMSMLLNMCCISVWAFGGNWLRRLLHKPRLMQVVHMAIVVLTGYCAVALWL